MPFAALLATFLLVPALAGAQTPAGSRALVVTGSSTVYPLMLDIVRRFEGLNQGVSIEVSSGGWAKGIADVRGGASDIAMVSRQLLENERDLFAFPLPGRRRHRRPRPSPSSSSSASSSGPGRYAATPRSSKTRR